MDELTRLVDDLQDASDNLDFMRARDLVAVAVKEYRPENDIDDRIWKAAKRFGQTKGNIEKVVDFPSRDETG